MTAAGSQRPARGPRRKAGTVLAAVRPLAEALAAESDVALWDVSFGRQAGRDTLTVAVDREGGIDADGLGRFATELSRRLDEADAVPGDDRYWLEVSSPGAERTLATPEHFRVCAGRHARLTFRDGREPLDAAVILAADDEVVEVDVPDAGRVRVPLGDISQATLRVPGV